MWWWRAVERMRQTLSTAARPGRAALPEMMHMQGSPGGACTHAHTALQLAAWNIRLGGSKEQQLSGPSAAVTLPAGRWPPVTDAARAAAAPLLAPFIALPCCPASTRTHPSRPWSRLLLRRAAAGAHSSCPRLPPPPSPAPLGWVCVGAAAMAAPGGAGPLGVGGASRRRRAARASTAAAPTHAPFFAPPAAMASPASWIEESVASLKQVSRPTAERRPPTAAPCRRSNRRSPPSLPGLLQAAPQRFLQSAALRTAARGAG